MRFLKDPSSTGTRKRRPVSPDYVEALLQVSVVSLGLRRSHQLKVSLPVPEVGRRVEENIQPRDPGEFIQRSGELLGLIRTCPFDKYNILVAPFLAINAGYGPPKAPQIAGSLPEEVSEHVVRRI